MVATLPDLVDPLDLPGADPVAVAAACNAVRAFCGWHIAPSVTATFGRRPGSPVLLLPSLKVTSVTSVTEDGATVDASVWDEDLVGDGILKRLAGAWCGRVAVEFVHGYETCPSEVLAVVASLAASGVDGSGASMLVAGSFTATFGASQQAGAVGMMPAHMAALMPYKLGHGA